MANPTASPATPLAQPTTSLSAQPGETTWIESQVTVYGAFRLFGAWVILLVLLLVLNATKMGHVVLYYLALLVLVLLLVTQYQAITSLLQPLSGGNQRG